MEGFEMKYFNDIKELMNAFRSIDFTGIGNYWNDYPELFSIYKAIKKSKATAEQTSIIKKNEDIVYRLYFATKNYTGHIINNDFIKIKDSFGFDNVDFKRQRSYVAHKSVYEHEEMTIRIVYTSKEVDIPTDRCIVSRLGKLLELDYYFYQADSKGEYHEIAHFTDEKEATEYLRNLCNDDMAYEYFLDPKFNKVVNKLGFEKSKHTDGANDYVKQDILIDYEDGEYSIYRRDETVEKNYFDFVKSYSDVLEFAKALMSIHKNDIWSNKKYRIFMSKTSKNKKKTKKE